MATNTQAPWQPIPFERPQAVPSARTAAFEAVCEELEGPADRFAMRQIGELVQRVFLPGHRGGHRYVTFSGLESTGMRPWLSARIGEVLAQQVAESVCLIEVDPNAGLSYEVAVKYDSPPATSGSELTYKAGRNLWICPAERFLRGDAWSPKSDLIREVLLTNAGEISVRDQINGADFRQLQWLFHFAADLEVALLNSTTVVARHKDDVLICELLSQGPAPHLRLVRGEYSPLQGWVAPTSARVAPAWVLVIEVGATLPYELDFHFRIDACQDHSEASQNSGSQLKSAFSEPAGTHA